MTSELEVDVYWSFRSPWSYLATPRLLSWQEKYNLKVNFRPVYPIAIRTPEFFSSAHPLWTSYFMTDVFRVAEFLELPFAWPQPDPVTMIRTDEGMHYPEEQPHIHRLTHLGVLAEERGRGIQFADTVSRLIWGGTIDWHLGSHLADAAAEAGLNLADMDATLETDQQRLAEVVERNQQAHEAAGHWGVPTCTFKGEPFFGQDRLDVLMWRLQQEGMSER